jgi:hypothetical protein
MVETKQLEERVKAEALMRPRWLIVRFLAGWLFSVAVLFILALMINIDWAKPKLEATMGDALHRNVHLGAPQVALWSQRHNGAHTLV